MYETSKPRFILCYEDVYRSLQEKILKDKMDQDNIFIHEQIDYYTDHHDFIPYDPLPIECAFIQYTSGTTGLPKGAMLSHQALINNIIAIGQSIALTHNDVAVSWLPLYHDMGLIGNFLTSLYWGCTICLIPTEYFVMQPTTFFKVIFEYGATVINSPNFGYVICNKYVNQKKMSGVRLDTLRFSLIGSDHIEFNDMQEFNEKFADYGLNTDIFLPVYGLAESCVAVTFSETCSRLKYDVINWERLNREGRAVSAFPAKRQTLRVISVGRPISGQQVKICAPGGEDLPDEMLGEICIKSTMLMSGYHNLPVDTGRAFRDGWFLTGDLGYMRDGILYFFERRRDMIRRGGRIYRPKDFEHYCWRVPDIKRGRSAVVGLDCGDQLDGENQLVCLLIETGTFYMEKYMEIIEQLNMIYLDELGEVPDFVHVVARGSIPSTSSGKLQRYKCRRKVLDGSFDTNFIYNNRKKEVVFYK
ncbi:hypothetical protein A6M21_08045 [Desulfotomaculum copahuensis]|uniref:AMP-dependent synthetase/ligase domain-containing protein n=2 Tax=Desulfotomaculum copahuensis TaxID=1838280 RepID=A0A1B7LG68_9FIRM|nr:hypothetical protein A6M21_08045 [Desulfotomaculum copahuensis]